MDASSKTLSQRFQNVAVPLAIVSACAFVQWRALFSFFSADDLFHLQQAAHLTATPHLPWRVLTQVVYFRFMFWLVGPTSGVFMLINLGLHALNANLLCAYLTGRGLPRPTAVLTAILFGACPLLTVAIGHAVVIDDIAALACSLVMLSWFQKPGRTAMIVATSAYVVALLCKESVLFLPLLMLVPYGRNEESRERLRTLRPALVVMGITAVGFLIARAFGGAPQGAAYDLSFWPAPIHNLATYTKWFLSFGSPLPDLARSFDPEAWRTALPALAIPGIVALAYPTARPFLALGFAWWLLGLLPVLPLGTIADPHFLYAALPGLALLAAVSAETVFMDIAKRTRRRKPTLQRFWMVAVSLVVVAYTVQAQSLVAQRYTLRLEGVDLPLDPQIRSIVVARRAVYSIAAAPLPPHTRMAILNDVERGHLGSSGHDQDPDDEVDVGRDLAPEILGQGRALRVFYPHLDSVLFAPRLNRGLAGFSLATISELGHITVYGPGLPAHLELVRQLEASGDSFAAREYVDSLRAAFPELGPIGGARR